MTATQIPLPSALRQFIAVLRHELGLFVQQFSGGIPSALLWLTIIAGACIWMPWKIGPYWISQPAFQLIYPLLASTLCIQSVIDSVTGERERDTLPSLLATPLVTSAYVFGKLGSVVLIATAIGTGALLLGAATVNIAYFQTGPHLPTAIGAVGIVALAFLAPLLLSAVGFLVALHARTVRQGVQAYAASVGFLPIAGGLAYLLFPEQFATVGSAFLNTNPVTRWCWILGFLASIDLVLVWLCLLQARRQFQFGGALGSRGKVLLLVTLSLAIVVAAIFVVREGSSDLRSEGTPTSLAQDRYRAEIEQEGITIPLEILVGSDSIALTSDALGIEPVAADKSRITNDDLFARWAARGTELHAQRFADDQLRGVLTSPAGTRFVEFVRVVRTADEPPDTANQWTEIQTTFINPDTDQALAGTLTMPSGEATAILVLVSGAGPQDRDHTVFGHRPFRELAHFLADHGYASLRYDDRGVGRSAGDFYTALTSDFATDASAALSHARSKLAGTPAGLLGHSEGGLAALIAANSAKPDFLVLMATPALPGDVTFMETHRDRLLRQGASPTLLRSAAEADGRIIGVLTDPSVTAIHEALGPLFQTLQTDTNLRLAYQQTGISFPYSDEAINAYAQKSKAWWQAALQFDPEPAIAALDVPILALMGALDWQLPARNAEATADAMRSARASSYVVRLTGHNHLLQEARTGSPLEYGTLDHGISPAALERIHFWLDSSIK